ncbi:MAG: cation:proton antiporter [Verrucomicrobiota bacterium]
MTTFAFLLFAAALAFGLGKWLRLPVTPMLILAGVGLGLLADGGSVVLSSDLLQDLVHIGLAVLVFAAGVELSPRRMRGRVRPIVWVALTQFLALGLSGFVVAWALGYGMTTAFYTGCALSASSTLVVVRHLQSRQQMFEPFGRLVLGVLLLQDLFIILILVILLRLSEGLQSIMLAVGSTVLLAALALVIHRWCAPWLTRHVRLEEEELMLGALALLFAFSGLAYLIELPFLVGAFFAGFSLSAFPMNGLVRGMLGSLSAFFLALFFICIGAFLTLPSLTIIGHSFILMVVLIVVTVVVVSVVAEAVGYSTRAAVESGILLSQTSEFSLLLALAGLSTGQISAELFSMIALITVSTMTLTPFLSRESVVWFLMRLHPRYRKGERRCEVMSGHAVLLGYGRAGARTVKLLKQHGLDVVVIDDDAGVIRKLIEQNIPCIQGDGSDPHMLEQAHCRQARMVLSSMRRSRDAQAAIHYLQATPVQIFVRTFEPAEAEQVRAAGGVPVETATAAADSLIAWLEGNLPARPHPS